ncbi:MAG: pyridoxal-phosphate dependent enzyme [Flavobacterium sp.]|nr:pyridoxal-phosphate dependent enzyme [Flavobacterium sp.]
MQFITYNNVYVQPIVNTSTKSPITLDVLRLDRLHNVVSGNKWFKLQLQIKACQQANKTTIATFGGAYSNHIVATAYACKLEGINSVGIIRGDETKQLNHTLQQAQSLGMQLQFVSRTEYGNKELLKQSLHCNNWYWVNEGGYAVLGAEGVTDVYKWIDDSYTHIACATGTGTTMAGLIKGAAPHQQVMGITALKKHDSLQQEITHLLTTKEAEKSFTIFNEYHFGGYAKHPKALLNWMNHLYTTYQLPTDIVYTSKMLYGIFNLIESGYFAKGSKIMAIHSGGLQGNLSLPKGSLVFD